MTFASSGIVDYSDVDKFFDIKMLFLNLLESYCSKAVIKNKI